MVYRLLLAVALPCLVIGQDADCILSEPTASSCSVTCGSGVVTLTRTILQEATGNGEPCDPSSLETTIPCNMPPCTSPDAAPSFEAKNGDLLFTVVEGHSMYKQVKNTDGNVMQGGPHELATTSMLAQLSEELSSTKAELSTTLVRLSESTAQALNQAAGSLESVVANSIDTLSTAQAGADGLLEQTLRSDMTTAVNGLSTAQQGVGDSVKTSLEERLESAITGLSTLEASKTNSLETSIGNLRTTLEGADDTLSKAVNTRIDQLANTLRTERNALSTSLSSQVKSLQGADASIDGKVTTLINQNLHSRLGAAESKISSLQSSVSKLQTDVGKKMDKDSRLEFDSAGRLKYLDGAFFTTTVVPKTISTNPNTWFTLVQGGQLAQGVYVLYINNLDTRRWGGSMWSEMVVTSPFPWYSSSTNDGSSENIDYEIFGHAKNDEVIYFRLYRNVGHNAPLLQMLTTRRWSGCQFQLRFLRIY